MSGPTLPVTSARTALAPELVRLHARQLGQRRGGPVEGDLDRLRAEVAQLGQRPLLDEAAVAQDADAIAERLDLAEDVRGQEDGLAALAWPRATVSRKATSISGSRPLVGSSRISRSARLANAATSCTFWRLPFDSARTFLAVSSWKRSTSASR